MTTEARNDKYFKPLEKPEIPEDMEVIIKNDAGYTIRMVKESLSKSVSFVLTHRILLKDGERTLLNSIKEKIYDYKFTDFFDYIFNFKDFESFSEGTKITIIVLQKIIIDCIGPREKQEKEIQ